MKNFINYYYNFDIYNIYFNNEKYFFYNAQDKYMLKICENPSMITSYIGLEQHLILYKYFFLVVPNSDGNYITWIENKPYVLLKLSNIGNDKVSIFDIKTDMYITLNNDNSSLNRFPWVKLWENKIDYFEEWFYSKQDSYKKFYSLFHYFIGMAENALLYLKECEREETVEDVDRLVVSHNRLNLDYSLYDYYDPTNIILDHASRDVGEYLKSSFVNKVWDLELFRDYLREHTFSKYGLRLLVARILFPSFFFDYIEDMIINNRDLDLLYLETRAEEFQIFISEILLLLNDEYNIPVIPWLIKKT